jgi:protein gp37
MSDLFHEYVPLDYIKRVFEIMRSTPQHTYQVLTKRSDRLIELAGKLKWADNVWMGVSTPAKIKFVSLEPLIGPVETLHLDSIDWIIIGGESGPKARPVRKEWVDSVFKMCKNHQVPFFFKQWGKPDFNPNPYDPTIVRGHMHYAKGGCQLDEKIYREMPARR